MFEIKFHCPKCQNPLNGYVCTICHSNNFKRDNYFDFLERAPRYDNAEISEIWKDVESESYQTGVRKFLAKKPENSHRFSKREGSVAFRAIQRNNQRCLIINGDLGNIAEFISDIFDEVYVLEMNLEKILIQKKRFDSKNIKNIILFRSNPSRLPFGKKFFDLIISIDVYSHYETNIENQEIINNINENKRVLSDSGCYCLCVKNGNQLKIFAEKKLSLKDNVFFGNFYKYNSLLRPLWGIIKPYWVLPSIDIPHHSGDIYDINSVNWFLNNYFKKFSVDRKWKYVGKILKINFPFRNVFLKLFLPAFIFYCYKKDLPYTIEEKIKNETNLKTIIQNSRLSKINYILIDNFIRAKKIVFCKVGKYDLTETIHPVTRIFPNMREPDDKIVIEDWKSGEVVDRTSKEDIKLALEWLVNFQNETSSDLIKVDEIIKEVETIRKNVSDIKSIATLPYEKWLEEYIQHMRKLELRKSGVHGDFYLRNILVDREKKLVNVIDWDWRFEEKGNPIYDFIWFMISLMSNSNQEFNEFSDLVKTGNASPNIKLIMETMIKHFRIDFDFVILIRFMILRFITFKEKNDPGIFYYVSLLKSMNV